MLNRFYKCYGFRSFSHSRVRENLEKAKPSGPAEPKEPPTSNFIGAVKLDFAPSEFEKRLLIWSGKYKSKDEIPERISFDVMNSAASRVRIKAANLMIVGTIVVFVLYIWHGKQRLKEGDTITKRILERDQKKLEEYKKSKGE